MKKSKKYMNTFTFKELQEAVVEMKHIKADTVFIDLVGLGSKYLIMSAMGSFKGKVCMLDYHKSGRWDWIEIIKNVVSFVLKHNPRIVIVTGEPISNIFKEEMKRRLTLEGFLQPIQYLIPPQKEPK